MGTAVRGATGTVQHDPERAGQPFSRDSLFRQVGPLVGGTLMGLLVVALPHTPDENLGLILRAGTLTALTVAATALLPWHRLPAVLQTAPPLMYLFVAYLLGQATGGPQSVYEQLVLIPVLWLAVYGTFLELALGLAAVAIVLLLPVMAPAANTQDWTRAATLMFVAGSLGFAVQRLLQQIRVQTLRLGVLALTDELTGAANRRAWNEYLADAVERARTERTSLCVAAVDLDHFKEFNDGHGHQGGDLFLKEVTACWRGRLRDSDVLARLGGDEFAILLPNCAMPVARRVVGRLGSDLPAGCTCSVGLVEWNGKETMDDLVARADAALYRAKDEGRDRVVVVV